jgi:hypothetical protein
LPGRRIGETMSLDNVRPNASDVGISSEPSNDMLAFDIFSQASET